ncbi:MAG: hypothetical protein ACLTSZ_06165 [Lachnospiraceae bacterium]
MTIIMVSHDVEFCAKYADLVSMFFDGRCRHNEHAESVLLAQQLLHDSSEPHEPACIRECSE